MGHFNFPLVSAWDSLPSDTSSEDLSNRNFGEYRTFQGSTRYSATLDSILSHSLCAIRECYTKQNKIL